jgi:hypothetical protein
MKVDNPEDAGHVILDKGLGPRPNSKTEVKSRLASPYSSASGRYT